VTTARVPLIVGIGGSTGVESVTTALLRSCLAKVAASGASTGLIAGPQLAALPLYEAEASVVAPAAEPLLAAVREADCVVLATPGYHGGMSGLLKNALDHLEALRGDPRPYLDGKAAGVIVSAAGWQAAGSALVSVRSAIHALRGWPTPFGVTVNSVEQRPDRNGTFDSRVDGALAILAGQLVEFARWRTMSEAATPAPWR
jgi:FMN reductase